MIHSKIFVFFPVNMTLKKSNIRTIWVRERVYSIAELNHHLSPQASAGTVLNGFGEGHHNPFQSLLAFLKINIIVK